MEQPGKISKRYTWLTPIRKVYPHHIGRKSNDSCLGLYGGCRLPGNWHSYRDSFFRRFIDLKNQRCDAIITQRKKMQYAKQHSVTFNYPDNLLFSLKLSEKEFEKEFKTAAVLKLYERGRLSSGIAADLLNITRVDFLNMLHEYKISYLGDDIEEILQDMKNAEI